MELSTDARRQVALGLAAAALLVIVVAGLAWVSASRPETPASQPPTVGWEVERPDGDEIFTAAGDLLGIAALPERDGVVVAGG